MPCTTILVGKHASNDSSTMISRTDDGHFDVKKLVVVEPKDQKKKSTSPTRPSGTPPAPAWTCPTASGRPRASTPPTWA